MKEEYKVMFARQGARYAVEPSVFVEAEDMEEAYDIAWAILSERWAIEIKEYKKMYPKDDYLRITNVYRNKLGGPYWGSLQVQQKREKDRLDGKDPICDSDTSDRGNDYRELPGSWP